MSYLLDTNAVIAIIGDRPSKVRVRFQQGMASGDEIAIPVPVSFELWFGVFGSRVREESALRLRQFLSTLDAVVDFDVEDAITAAEIRTYLARRGPPIGPYDLLIAAQALRRDATLVTSNLGEFGRVPGLKCEDWTGGSGA